MCIADMERELEAVFQEQKLFDEKYVSTLNNLLKNKKIKKTININFIKHMLKDNSLYLFDEQIFEIYKSIIQNYEAFLGKVSDIDLEFNEEVLKNLRGIISVLKSQVDFFYEDSNDMKKNPIAQEKKKIVATYINKIYCEIDAIIKENAKDINADMTKEEFFEIFYKKINYAYENNLFECFNVINDMENREKMNHYNNVLEEEREILSSIIKVQINALEKLCVTDEERDIMIDILKPIREVYQHTNKKFDELFLEIKMIEPMLNISFQNDNKNIQNLIENTFKNLKIMNKNNYKKYNESIRNYISLFCKKEKKIVKNKVENANIFSEIVSEKFKKLCEYIRQNKQCLENVEGDKIIDGILESLSIKQENIEEKGQFIKNVDKIIQLIEKKAENIENINEIFNEKNDEKNNIFEKINNFVKNNKKNIKIDEKINEFVKSIDEFIKNTILFEISTFQEIIYYSVTRLREIENADIKNLVKEIDMAEKDIEKALISYDILLIRPMPHDMFNAKEQEIIVAEKTNKFMKGEVVKVINCGYKTKDEMVIKRATIIAAK